MLKAVTQNDKECPQLEQMWIESRVLAGNAAGEQAVRPLTVFMPKQAQDRGRKFPVLYCLAPWTSAGRCAFDWQPFRESLFDRLTRLIDNGEIPPCVVVSPDLYTSFGGSQYIDSSYLGLHSKHLVEELIPFVEQTFPVLPGSQSRGIFGRSSGGFGALRLVMDHPNSFAAVACHSGDLGFEGVYRRELMALPNGLSRFDADAEKFLQHCRQAVKLSGQQVHLLMLLGMAASYSPNANSNLGYDLPIDLVSGEVDESVWARWLAHDPVAMVDALQHQKSLSQLTCLYIECGNRDQYNLHYGARQFNRKLKNFAIDHHYFEFDDNHSGTSYRYDVSLPLLLKNLQQS